MATAKASTAAEMKAAGAFSYSIEGEETATFALPPEALALPGHLFNALHFAIKTAARNATAGLMEKEPAKAAQRVAARFAAWSKGEWAAVGQRGEAGEKSASILARAVAEALGSTPDDAADMISASIGELVEKAGLDPDSEEESEKVKIRKIATDFRASLRDSEDVKPIVLRLRAEEAAKKAANVEKSEGAKKATELLKRNAAA